MYYVYGDWNDDAVELYSSNDFKSALRFAECYMLTHKLKLELGHYYSLDVVFFEPDYCDDTSCSCHRYRGKSLWHVEAELSLAA